MNNLTGKVINLVLYGDDCVYEAIVAACDDEKGMTIISAENPEHILACIAIPDEGDPHFTKTVAVYNLMKAGVEAGFLDLKEIGVLTGCRPVEVETLADIQKVCPFRGGDNI